ncbi:MAG: FAD-binding oxidoreductase [Elainella sp. Prado103]|nr:FAD-binding oxidoreductase [Elainella sp. Prado103]
MKQVTIVGCGVVGAMIAYELSHLPELKITVLDRQPPAQDSTGAALGVLMGIISQKTKGKAWNLRQASIQRYATLIPELAAAIGRSLPWNTQGILKLCFDSAELPRWHQLATLRQQQGWTLEVWSIDQVAQRCPQVRCDGGSAHRLVGAIYSPQDYQIDPTALTLALVQAAQARGVTFRFDAPVERLLPAVSAEAAHAHSQACQQLQTATEVLASDWVVIAAGLGSTPLTQSASPPVALQPVLGQALKIHCPALDQSSFQPVITGNDIHLVPIGHSEYWIGATVEFPPDPAGIAPNHFLQPEAARLESLWQGAIEIWPALIKATVLKSWSGLRPRPVNRPAPIIEFLPGYTNVCVATGHYRNGVLLAPATAQLVRSMLQTAWGG